MTRGRIRLFRELAETGGLMVATHLHLTVEMLAEQAHMSPRNFARSYKEKTGQTPARALELFRLEAARRLLEQTRSSATEIARKCGFGTEERMRVTFKRHLKVSPSDYRNHFSAH